MYIYNVYIYNVYIYIMYIYIYIIYVYIYIHTHTPSFCLTTPSKIRQLSSASGSTCNILIIRHTQMVNNWVWSTGSKWLSGLQVTSGYTWAMSQSQTWLRYSGISDSPTKHPTSHSPITCPPKSPSLLPVEPWLLLYPLKFPGVLDLDSLKRCHLRGAFNPDFCRSTKLQP